MADDFLFINSLDELKKKLNMNFMNKKFKDSEGNKYIVRFVKETRKLEIFRLQTKAELEKNPIEKKEVFLEKEISLDKESSFEDKNFLESIISSQHETTKATPIQTDKLNQTLSKIKSIFTFSKIKAVEEEIEDDFDLNIEESPLKEEPKKFENTIEIPNTIQETKFYFVKILKSLEKDKDRINSSIANLKSSKFFELVGDPSENKNILSNVTREFDSEIFKSLEVYSNKLKEITTYPKSLNNYTMNYNRTQKDFLASLNSNELKLDYVLQWDILDNLILFCNRFSKMTTELLNILNKKNDLKKLNSVQAGLFEDSKSGIIFCLNDLNYLRRNLDEYKKKVKQNA